MFRVRVVLVALMVVSLITTSNTISARSSIGGILPEPTDHLQGFEVIEDGVRTLRQQAETFSHPDVTRSLLAEWGWRENVARTFASTALLPDGVPTAYLDISVTRFDTPEGASAALPYFVASRIDATGEVELPVLDPIGDETRSMSGPVGARFATTTYAREGPFLIRISMDWPGERGDPPAYPNHIQEAIVARAAEAHVDDSLAVLLPLGAPLPDADCFRLDDAGSYDFAAIVERFPGVPTAGARLAALGWEDGAFRQFGCDRPPAGRAGWIDLSVHRFGDEASARAAVPFFAESRALDTDLVAAPAPEIGDSAAALDGPAINGEEYTLYVASGRLLFRVTGVGPDSRPIRDVERAMLGLIAVVSGAEPTSQQIVETPTRMPTTAIPATATPLPIATPSPTLIPTETPPPTPTPLPMATATMVPRATATPSPIVLPTAIPTATPTQPPEPTPALSPTTVATTCTLVELYPGYPGYRGYVTGVSWYGEGACLEDLFSADPTFDKAREDAANLRAAEAIGLAGTPDLWTWENWMAIEAERGLPPTCYSCLLGTDKGQSLDAPVLDHDPRLAIGGYGTTYWITGIGGSGFGIRSLFPRDDVLRAFVGLANPGHLNAQQVDEAGHAVYEFFGEPGYHDVSVEALWATVAAQGGYVPTPPMAALDDQWYTVQGAVEAACGQLPAMTCDALVARTEQGWVEWQAAGGPATGESFGQWLGRQFSI